MSAILKEPLSEQELIERYGDKVTHSLNCNELAERELKRTEHGLRDEHGLWQPGVSPNPKGRPKGSRNALSEDFVRDVHEAWVSHGIDAISAMLAESPTKFVQMVAQIIPKDFQVSVDDGTNTKWVISAVPLTSSEWIAHHSLAQPIDVIEDSVDQGSSE